VTIDTQASDADLIARSLAEPDLFTAVFDRHSAEILRYVYARLGAELAEDVTAETFLAAFGCRDRYNGAGPDARPWPSPPGPLHHPPGRDAAGVGTVPGVHGRFAAVAEERQYGRSGRATRRPEQRHGARVRAAHQACAVLRSACACYFARKVK
jgi:Sigma-70 region 2